MAGEHSQRVQFHIESVSGLPHSNTVLFRKMSSLAVCVNSASLDTGVLKTTSRALSLRRGKDAEWHETLPYMNVKDMSLLHFSLVYRVPWSQKPRLIARSINTRVDALLGSHGKNDFKKTIEIPLSPSKDGEPVEDGDTIILRLNIRHLSTSGSTEREAGLAMALKRASVHQIRTDDAFDPAATVVQLPPTPGSESVKVHFDLAPPPEKAHAILAA